MPEKRKKTIDAAADRQTMTELYETYEQKMFGIANAILHNDWQAEDAVHEAFIKLTRHLDGIDEIKSHKTKAFIVIIIRCVALDMLDKEKRNKIYSFDDIGNKAITEDTMIENIEFKELCSVIKALPAIHRDIIELKVYYEFSDKEISDILDHIEETGTVLRAKGIVEAKDGSWLHFDYIPGEKDIRTGGAQLTGKACVIGTDLDEEKIRKMFVC